MRRIIQSTGCEVIHLGHDRSVEEVVNCAIQEDAQAIAMTSYQGGHNEYFKYMHDLLQEKGAPNIKIFGGGGGTILPTEIAELEDVEEQEMFLEELGLEKPGVHYLIQSTYKLLKLQTYFTAGVKEVRAWTITKGTKAPQAAAVIHTDFEKGFIRAEVMAYNDYVTLGSEQACRDNGKLSVEGKDYVVQDGDIMHFRFNV